MTEGLKPYRFFIVQIGVWGGGIEGAVRQFDPDGFDLSVGQARREMELYHFDGRPLVIDLAVSDPIHLNWPSPRGSINALFEAVENAVKKALSTSNALVEINQPVKPAY